MQEQGITIRWIEAGMDWDFFEPLMEREILRCPITAERRSEEPATANMGPSEGSGSEEEDKE